jgi:hypothetical protein
MLAQVRRSLGVLVGAALMGCLTSEPELRPSTVTQRGGVELVVDTATAARGGPAIVLIDGVPAHTVVIEAPGLLRVRLPSLPRSGMVDVEVSFANGTAIRMEGALEVVAPELEVRARK